MKTPLMAVLALALAAAPAHPAERPKIGIALSGGGARGVAHIGVLKVMEELHIPVDYIAGTSMGSIIGGLYASGMTPEEIEREVLAIDWADALQDKPPRAQLSFRRKNDDLRYIPDFELGVGRHGLRYPTGLRSGQKLGFLLRRMTLPVREVEDFDRLPIPFRAVATDIGTGEMVVLSHGDLARALRASMAIPSAFSPVEIDGRVLVDGGLSDNIPVDVVRAMGADVVIGIDIGEPLLTTEEARRSLFSILAQTLGTLTRANMKTRLEDADLVITPAVADYGTMAFSQSPEILQRGVEKAREMASQLALYAVPEEEYRQWREARRQQVTSAPVVDSVRFEGNQRVDSRVLEHLVELKAGRELDLGLVESDLGRAYGLGDFEAIDFELRDTQPGHADAVYRLREKPWGPNYLRFGLELRTDANGRNDLGVLAKLNVTRLNARGAEWTTAAKFGGNRYVISELYQPLSFRTGWFVAANAAYDDRLTSFYDAGDKIADLSVRDTFVGGDIGYTFGEYGEARLGIARRWTVARESTGSVPPEAQPFLDRNIDLGGARFTAIVDRLDSAKLPHQGGLFQLSGYRSLEALGAEDEFTKAVLRMSKFFTRGRHTGFAQLNAAFSPSEDLPVYAEFTFGGLFSLSGFADDQLRTQDFGVLRLGYLYRLAGSLHVGGYVEAGEGTVTNDPIATPILAATAIAAYDSVLGPVYLGYGAAEGNNQKVYFLFGRSF